MADRSGPDALANMMAAVLDNLAPIVEAAVGYRTQLESAGYSPTMAEQLAAQFHFGMVYMVLAEIMKPTKKDA